MTGSFTQKIVHVNFVLANGMFVGGGNAKLVRGLRVVAHVRKPGTPEKNGLDLKVYGMIPEDINALSTAGVNPLAVQKNLVQVLAGDSDGLTTVFQGEITGAWADYATPPDLVFEVKAVDGHFPSIAPLAPFSAGGTVQATKIFASLASSMGYAFEPNDIGGMPVLNPYLHGTAAEQAHQLSQMLGVEYGLDSGTLFVAQKGSLRVPNGVVPIISPSSGLIGYPVWNKGMLQVSALLNPAFKLGGAVIIQGSAVTRANGQWRIHGLEHRIASKHHHMSEWTSMLNLVKAGV